MDSAVAALQNVINRFAVVGGFPRVGVDGQWGAQTRQGVYSALSFIGQGKCYQVACPDFETSRAAAQIMTQWDESMTAARGLSEFLGRVADDLGMPLVAAPIPGSTSTPSGPITHVPPFQASLIERLKLIPLWQQITVGVVGGLALIIVVNQLRGWPQPRRARRAA